MGVSLTKSGNYRNACKVVWLYRHFPDNEVVNRVGSLGDLESLVDNKLDGAECCVAVILFLLLAQLLVGDDTGVGLEVVVAIRPIFPSLADARQSPHLVDVAGKLLGECQQFIRQFDLLTSSQIFC